MSVQFVIRVYDQDANAPLERLASHQFIGEFPFVLTNLMMAPGQKLSGNLVSGRARLVKCTHAHPQHRADENE
jgi:hypothetical protein